MKRVALDILNGIIGSRLTDLEEKERERVEEEILARFGYRDKKSRNIGRNKKKKTDD